jgi:hypothetical protein
MPWPLRKSYLLTLIATSVALEALCLGLLLLSEMNNGLADNRSSIAFDFAWGYVPTIVAVCYTILWVPVAKEVVRTEP